MNIYSLLLVLYSAPIFVQVDGYQKCMGKNIEVNDDLKTAIKTCSGKHKAEQGKMNPCFLPCVYSETGCVVDNKFNTEKFKTVVMNKYPSEAQSAINEGAAKCASAGSTLSMEDNCKSWATLVGCLWGNHGKVCKSSSEKATENEDMED